MKSYLIGVDVGSSFTKATLFDVEGRAIADARQDTHPRQPRAGVAEYDAPLLLSAALVAIKEVIVAAKVPSNRIAAICLDGMISGAMGIDAEGQATTPYTTTLDMRFAPQLNHVMEHFHDPIRAQTGSGQPTIGPKMMWIRDEFPDLYQKTAKFVTITGYMIGQLADLSADNAFMDYTYLWASGLSDTRNYRWSDELCQAMALPVEKLPQIVEPFAIVGRISQKAANASGLQAGTPIVAGAGDQSAAFIGAALTKPNCIGDAVGTFPIISLCTDEFRPDMQNKLAEIIPSAIPGLWHSASLIIGGGLTHHWFQETFAHQDREEAQAHGRTVYDLLDEKAGRLPPGSDRLVFIPHLGGRACPTRTNYRGSWFGLTWTHQREHFYRSVLEAVAYDQALALEALKAATPGFEAKVEGEAIVVYGGGARSRLWNQIKANVMGMPYVALEREDLSALGAAILCAYALKIYDDLPETAKRFAVQTERFEVDPAAHDLYRHYAQFYGTLLDQVDPAYTALAALPSAER